MNVTLCNRGHPEYGAATIPLPIPDEEYARCMELLEAMAIGLPTICTDCPCGGARAVIENGKNGLLIPVGSKSDLIVAMERIADRPELAERLSMNGSAIRNKLAPGAVVGSWLSVF